jgi:hypothetical protein
MSKDDIISLILFFCILLLEFEIDDIFRDHESSLNL